MRARRLGPLVPVIAILALAQGLLGADCVDGVTPDCSGEAGAQCGPVEAGGADTSVTVPEGGDTSTPDATGDAADAAPDAADASDAG